MIRELPRDDALVLLENIATANDLRPPAHDAHVAQSAGTLLAAGRFNELELRVIRTELRLNPPRVR